MKHWPAPLTTLRTAVLVACATVSLSALADSAWISVPSTSSAGQLLVTGGGFTSGQVLTLQITNPAGRTNAVSRTANAKGRIAAALSPVRSGMYSVDVTDSAGERVGGGNFIHMP